MKTAFYISPTGQASANPDASTHATLSAQGYRRVGFLRWLWNSLTKPTMP